MVELVDLLRLEQSAKWVAYRSDLLSPFRPTEDLLLEAWTLHDSQLVLYLTLEDN